MQSDVFLAAKRRYLLLCCTQVLALWELSAIAENFNLIRIFMKRNSAALLQIFRVQNNKICQKT
jgi:hypothetical protein